MKKNIDHINAQIPGWGKTKDLAVEQIGGLTNTNYLVRVNGERFVLRFFAAMWGMLQSGLQVEGIIPMIDGFDCLEYTEETFAQMRELIQ